MQTDQTSAEEKAVMEKINSGDIRKLFEEEEKWSFRGKWHLRSAWN